MILAIQNLSTVTAGYSHVTKTVLHITAEDVSERLKLLQLTEQAHRAQMQSIRDGIAGIGNAMGQSASDKGGVDSVCIDISLGGPNYTKRQERIAGLLKEAQRLNGAP